MSDDNSRREFLLSLIHAAISEHDRWASDPDHVYVTAGVDGAMIDLIDGFSEGSVPSDCRQLQQLVAAFGDHWHAWQAESDRRGSSTVPPSDSCWKSWEALVAIYRGVTEPVRRPIESVATLRSQQVPDRQICEIYGWMDARGCPEVWRVEEEMATPGKHTTGWVDPVTRHRQEAAERQRTLTERVQQLRERKVARMSATPPESLADLIHQQVPVHQIAEMLRISQAEVISLCDAQNLPRPPGDVSIQSTRGQYDAELSEPAARQFDAQHAEGERVRAADARASMTAPSPIDADGNVLTLEQQIIQYHEQGFELADIARDLTTDTEKVTARKVAAVIKRYEEDPDAFT